MGQSLLTQWLEHGACIGGFKHSVALLNTDTAEHNVWLFPLAVSFAADVAGGNLGQVEENLSVKHTVLVQVKDLGSARVPGLLLLSKTSLLTRVTILGFSQFGLPRLLHLLKLTLVRFHLFLSSLEFGLHLRIGFSAAGSATHHGLQLLVLLLELTNNLVLGRLIDDWLVLNLLGSVGPDQSVVGLVVIGQTGADSAHHDGG